MIQQLFAVLLVSLTAATCSQAPHDPTTTPFTGTWTIVKAVRNLDDITAGCDFGRSLITLHSDGTYTVERTALFPVTRDGSWTVRKHPGGDIITLNPAASSPPAAFEMQSDTTGDGNNIIAKFTTRSSNTYQYLLKKISPKEKSKP
ncbi:MAG: DUF5004 domain-containing protein [Bacteroidetes bacterium]|nr:DUF5004 domain-containing protein [Bacteroidota bacterium]